MHNDLEYALFDKFPLLEVLRRNLMSTGALRVMVSGSGSSLIALFSDKETRQRAAEEIKILLEDPVSAVFELGE
jgi:4-diphosphocytidyl-2-C-methyl-D-erythritol kinase